MEESLCLQQRWKKGRVGQEEIAKIAGIAKIGQLKTQGSFTAEDAEEGERQSNEPAAARVPPLRTSVPQARSLVLAVSPS